MKNFNVKLIIGVSMIIVVSLLGLYSFGDIKYSSKAGLTYEEKKRDAKYLIDFLSDTYPYFEEIKKEVGKDILGNKSKIINSISKTSSDEEFYDSISKFFRNFIYGTAEITNDLEYFGRNFTYVDKDLNLNSSTYREKALKGKEKWAPIQQKYWQNSYTPGNVNFFYSNGRYYVNVSQNPEVHIGDKLLKVEGMPVDEYVDKMPHDKYYKTYDYTYEKYVRLFDIVALKGKDSKITITIENSLGDEKEVEILPFEESMPLLEDGYAKSRNQQSSNEQVEDFKNRNFLSSFDASKILALDFLAFNDINKYHTDSKYKEDVLLSIDKSNTLVIDLRGGYDETMLLDILGYIAVKDIEEFNYRVIKRSKINDEFIISFRNTLNPFITEISSPIDTLEERYPLSEYYTFKEKKFEIKGKDKYKGKVFILYDGSFYSDYTGQLIKCIIENNLGTVISHGKFNIKDFPNYNSMTSSILPNSNLMIVVNNGKAVDSKGEFVEAEVVTPQVILEKDIDLIIDLLKKGEGDEMNMLQKKKYTEEDKYYNKVLELLK